MIIALDYDGTYTSDPHLWDVFIELCKARGHTVICVTGRSGLMDRVDITDQNIKVIYSGCDLKAEHCKNLGINIDIWIDDMPGMIEPARILEW